MHNSSDLNAGIRVKIDGVEIENLTFDDLKSNFNMHFGDWRLLTIYFDLSDQSSFNELTVELFTDDDVAYFDDFRVHPADVPMIMNVYDSHSGRLTYQLNEHNVYTRYEEDFNTGRTAIYVETPSGEIKQSQTEIHIAQ